MQTLTTETKKDSSKLGKAAHHLVLTLMVFLVTSCVAQSSTPVTDDTNPPAGDSFSTSGVLCDLEASGYNAGASVQQDYSYSWTCSDAERALNANGIPNHEVGTFPNEGNPNTISEQDTDATFTLNPVQTDTATELGGPRGAVAHALNGIKFDPDTGGTCDDSGSICSGGGGTGNWRMEALGQTAFNFGEDFNNAHVQPTGEYHYHGLPESLLDQLSEAENTMTLIGWAADGFPVYARYGYSDPNDASSAIKVVTGSYQTKATPDANRPSTELYAMGTFKQDWEYVEGLGDLDECNGRVGVTPEFPEGIYHYYATDTYPYMTRCVKGEVAAGNGPGGPGAGGPSAGGPEGPGGPSAGGPPNFTVAAQTPGVSEDVLRSALGDPPPNFEAAADTLGISLNALRSALDAASR